MGSGKELVVTVSKAKLESAHSTYASLSLADTKVQTATAEKDANPVYNETFTFPVGDAGTHDLRIILYRTSRVFGTKEVGWADVPLTSLRQGEDTPLVVRLTVGATSSLTNVVHLSLKAQGFGATGPVQKLISSTGVGQLQMLAPYIEKAKPLLGVLESVVEAAWPLLRRLWELVRELYAKYQGKAFLPIAVGLVMVLFGGHFMTIIAAVEAYRMCGWTRTQHSLELVYRELKAAHLVLSEADEDWDATKAPSNARQLELICSAVDPVAIEEGIAGLRAGTLAVVATLRTQFAHAVTLGASVGDMGYRQVGVHLVPIIKNGLPEPYHKWVPLAVRFVMASVACSFSWMLLRLFTAFHSAVFGANLVATGIKNYLVLHKKMTPARADSLDLAMAAWGVGILGFLWQLKSGFQLPFPFNLLLLPFTILEWVLMMVVNWN